MPKYDDLVQALRTAMADGTYAKGERLPTVPELCRLYGVSNTTVKKAMDALELQGLVARRRGSGVYVKGIPAAGGRSGQGWDVSAQMTGLTNEYAAQGIAVESVVHDFSVVRPPEREREVLGMGAEDFAYHVCRVRVAGGRPCVVEYTYMPLDVVPGLHESHLSGSIYGYLENELGLKIGSAHRTIQAVMPTEDERAWLGLGEGEPLLEVRQVGYLDDGTPFEASRSRHTADYEFHSISTR